VPHRPTGLLLAEFTSFVGGGRATFPSPAAKWLANRAFPPAALPCPVP